MFLLGLQEKAKVETEDLNPPLRWIPWVVVGGEAINDQQLADASHIARKVCEAYTGSRCDLLRRLCRVYSAPPGMVQPAQLCRGCGERPSCARCLLRSMLLRQATLSKRVAKLLTLAGMPRRPAACDK